jgi:hypothetical protein
MANGDAAECGEHRRALADLERRMGNVETAVEKIGDCVQRLETDNTLRKAGLDTGAKVLIALLGILGPLLAIVVAHYMQ